MALQSVIESAPNRNTGHERLSTIVGGLLADLQELLRQEVALILSDFRLENGRHRVVTRYFVASAMMLFGALWAVSLGLVVVLYETVDFTLWQSLLAVGGGLFLSGLLVLYFGKRKQELIYGRTDTSHGKKSFGDSLIDC